MEALGGVNVREFFDDETAHCIVRNCREIICAISCLFLRQHYPKISYIARYAPDFWTVLSKKNPANYLQIILRQFLKDYEINVNESINNNSVIYEPMIEHITLRKYTNNDYNFVYQVKKNAYKKYVEECWGAWVEEDQQKYFVNFINQVRENAYIIQYDNKDIGFYNGKVLENGNYEVGNICIVSEYQGKGIGTKILKDILEKYSNTDIEIQYFKQNPVGSLYERLGFEKSGETNFHYQMLKSKSVKLKK